MAARKGISAARVKLTYDDFMRLPEDGQRHEVIDGEHYVTPSPNTRHQTISMNLILLIGGWLDTHPIGRLYHAPFDVVFSPFDVVEPDLLYISHQRRHDIVTAAHVRGVPDLVVEIGSTGTHERDETVKRRLYERFGVEEYWFVDPEIDIVRVYRPVDNRFAGGLELSRRAGEVLTTPLLPGLAMPLAGVFRD